MAAALVLSWASPGFADEGMWTFDNFPAAAVKAELGVRIDQAWLDKVRSATARLSIGCSSSIVSGHGLLFTNHHCVADCEADLSTPAKDYVKDGFEASTGREERQCPGMEADVLQTVSDVSDQLRAATLGKTGQAFVAARTEAMARIETATCAGKETVAACEVVSLYGGGQYKLYVYRKYTDVRLVFTPDSDAADFGGDPDNFNFPRYDLDVAFLRLYADGKPVPTPAHLQWNASPPAQAQPVFVVGNPGSTNRLYTADQLETLRDVVLPQFLLRDSELRGRLIAFGDQGPEQRRIANGELLGVENDFKESFGAFQSLSDPGFIPARRAADSELQGRVAADPSLKARVGDPWAEIARAQAALADQDAAYSLIEVAPGADSQLYNYARTLVRVAQERAKPNGQRLTEYSEARLPLLQKQVLDPRPVYPQLERLELEFWLSKIREYLTPDAAETKVFLGADSPEDLAARLSTSRLSDPALRQAFWAGGLPAVEASDDPLIVYVLATDPAARALRRAHEESVGGPVASAAARIAAARFAVYGAAVYPDATFTPRLSYGKVEGWTSHGRSVGAFTTFGGLWRRASGKPPFQLGPVWFAARGKLNNDTILNFTTDNDIAGGNSGSPVINARGEVIGAAFDGNLLSLGGPFAFDDQVNRTVAVSAAAVTEALAMVYDDGPLLSELRAP
jgi:hypothetical protein